MEYKLIKVSICLALFLACASAFPKNSSREREQSITTDDSCDYCCNYVCDLGTTRYCPDENRCEECYPHTEETTVFCPPQWNCEYCYGGQPTCEPCYTCPECETQAPCPSPPTQPPTEAPIENSLPAFTKVLYQSSLASWPIAGTTLHLGIHANTTDGAPIRYELLTSFEFLTLTSSQDIIFTSNVSDGAFVGPNNVMLVEVAAYVIGEDGRMNKAVVALVFPRSLNDGMVE